MFPNTKTTLLCALLALTPLAAAHGKVASVTGDAGGNGTALGIQGGIVPGTGKNRKTEVDTTVFAQRKIATDGLGETAHHGDNQLDDLAATMAASGATLPQVASRLHAVFHVVTSDGCGPVKAVLDTTATGAFSAGTPLANATADVAGRKGNCPDSITAGSQDDEQEKRSVLRRVLEAAGVLAKRGATNVNRDFDVAFEVPAGTTCTGTVAGLENVCLVKIANENKAGPFGGVVAIQMAAAAAAGNATRRSVARVNKVWEV